MSKNPLVTAKFILDESGKPTAIVNSGVKHYAIRLQVHDVPEDTYAITYKLDDSYYEPIRESLIKDTNFTTDLTSYGDYTVCAHVRTKQCVVPVSLNLSKALKLSHTSDLTPDIAAALKDIESN